jgi:hypothetical protein
MSEAKQGTGVAIPGRDPIPTLLASTLLRHVYLHDSLPLTNVLALAANSQLLHAWKSLCALTNQHVEVQADGNSIDGICIGVDD